MSASHRGREIQYVGENGAVVREAVKALDGEIALQSHETAAQARAALSDNSVDCVVCDQQLPDESGPSVVQLAAHIWRCTGCGHVQMYTHASHRRVNPS